MGQEIPRTEFCEADFAAFQERLAEETAILLRRFRDGGCCETGHEIGFELEAWVVDRNHLPVPDNEAYLARLADPLVVPELSRFNVELNGTPQPAHGTPFTAIEKELTATWRRCLSVAGESGDKLVLIGILPTVRKQDLTVTNISPLNRYLALNQQILARRYGRPISIRIAGREPLALTHEDVMLEAATTSFQIHLKTPASESARHFNASLIASAPVLAVGVNSPFLFEHLLWEETRIPLFEQAVDTGEAGLPSHRVSFGSGYVTQSVAEIFAENLSGFSVLLPIALGGNLEFPHLRLHNGTIWRWNRPLIGFEADGTPHVRIEQRVLPAGPSILDMVANAAFYVGLCHALAERPTPPEADLAFHVAQRNFYAAARHGLDAEITWLDGRAVPVSELVLAELLASAGEGLQGLGVAVDEASRLLDVVALRVRSGQTGAAWQRGFVEKHGRDFARLTGAYLERQRSGAPVHEWSL